MQGFVYQGWPARVIFGAGARRQAPQEAQRLGLQRVLVLCSPGQREQAREVQAQLGALAVGLFDRAAMHTPTDVTQTALAMVTGQRVDGVVSFGGGSAIGLGKAIALHTDVAQIVLPTSYAGSEMTPILGQTENGRKTTLRSSKVLPETVLYDVELTLSLPPAFSAASGLNALAHAAEALYAQDANPVISLLAEEGVRALFDSLLDVVRAPSDAAARGRAQYGAYLCGTALGAVGMALHHKLCHALGGSFDLPHAETHAVLLPHVLAYNAPATPTACAALRRALRADDVPSALWHWGGELGVPRALADIGMPRQGIVAAVDQTLTAPYWNPRPLRRDALILMLENAWAGRAPATT